MDRRSRIAHPAANWRSAWERRTFMKVTGCECVVPGWCERHQCFKSLQLFRFCQMHRGTFQLWEQGRGPGQGSSQRRWPLRTAACVHRGAPLGEQPCPTCRGAIRLNVFSCPLYGPCTIGRPLAGWACCATCADYQTGTTADRTETSTMEGEGRVPCRA
jgi:hypothetical protein